MSDPRAHSHLLVGQLLERKYELGETAVQLEDAEEVEHMMH